MPANVQIIFHSLYGHVHTLANEIAAGAREVAGTDVHIYRVPETLSDDVLAKMHATDTVKALADIPAADPHQLADADAIILGSPTRYGSNTAQMQAFLDATGSLWAGGKLINKVGAAFTSTASQHGGQETTLLHMYTFFIHQGMTVAGVPYSAQQLLNLDEISGGTPYGSSTIAGPTGQRAVSENEKAIARAQGKHVAQLATWIKAGQAG